MCGPVKRDEPEHPDIGFAILPETENLGYAYEASAAVLADDRKRLGISHVLGITTRENIRSIRLLEKLGLHFEKTIQTAGIHRPVMLFRNQNPLNMRPYSSGTA